MTGQNTYRYTFTVDIVDPPNLEYIYELVDAMRPYGKVRLVGNKTPEGQAASRNDALEFDHTPDSPALVSDVAQSHADLDGRVEDLGHLAHNVSQQVSAALERIAKLEEELRHVYQCSKFGDFSQVGRPPA